MKGEKLVFKGKNLFHTIDKSRGEHLLSRKVFGVVKAVKDAAMIPFGLTEQDWWKTIKHIDVNGVAWVKLDVDGETKNVQIVKRKPDALDLEIGPTITNHLHKLGNFDLAAKVLDVNAMTLRGKKEEEFARWTRLCAWTGREWEGEHSVDPGV
eukprot:6974711-Pyramimonas_sp.AAC.1